jgi:plastocyanin
MKILYIFLFVVALVAAYYFVAGPPNQIAENTDNDEHMEETVSHSDDESNMGDNQDAESQMNEEMEPERSLGDDAGMEFPIVENENVLTEKEFTLDGFNFGYDIKEIRVKKGDTVTINLTVSEGFHDWVVEEFNAATTQIREGGVASVTFVADKTGTFEYYCSVGQHRANGMVGKLIVE